MDASLCSLEAASFLRQDPQEPATWRFCQLLARDVVYEMVPKDVRRDWHAAAAATAKAAALVAEATQVCRLPALLCTPLHPFALHAVSPCPLLLAMATHQSTVAHPACSPIALQWPRSFRAAEWWERSALDAVDNGTYSDALPLLQKAQVGA